MNITIEQLTAFVKLILRWERVPDEIQMGLLTEVLMVRYDTLWIGIEPDGYTHT